MLRLKFCTKWLNGEYWFYFTALRDGKPYCDYLPIYGKSESLADVMEYLKHILLGEMPQLDLNNYSFKRVQDKSSKGYRYIEWESL